MSKKETEAAGDGSICEFLQDCESCEAAEQSVGFYDNRITYFIEENTWKTQNLF